jgi:hypothetical protein
VSLGWHARTLRSGVNKMLFWAQVLPRSQACHPRDLTRWKCLLCAVSARFCTQAEKSLRPPLICGETESRGESGGCEHVRRPPSLRLVEVKPARILIPLPSYSSATLHNSLHQHLHPRQAIWRGAMEKSARQFFLRRCGTVEFIIQIGDPPHYNSPAFESHSSGPH